MSTTRPESVADKIKEVRDSMPRREAMALIKNGTSVQQTIMRKAIEESSADVGDVVEQWWLPESGYVVIDLGVDDD